jgi:hypothetical protein
LNVRLAFGIRVGLLGAFLAVVVLVCARESRAVATGAPTSPEATRAFGRWLDNRYGSAHGYWTCPKGQIFRNSAGCLAEVLVARTRHLTSADATMRNGRIIFVHVSDTRWVRRWSVFSATVLRRGASYHLPGKASVNSSAFDWWWLASGAYSSWQRDRRSFVVNALDGNSAGLGRIYKFACGVLGRTVTCKNVLGDAMRYMP